VAVSTATPTRAPRNPVPATRRSGSVCGAPKDAPVSRFAPLWAPGLDGIGAWSSPGIGHRASGIGHRASGIGHRASGIGTRLAIRGRADPVGLYLNAKIPLLRWENG
jgi:hypothetical protein